MFGNSSLMQLPCAGSLMVCQPPCSGLRCMKQREVRFGIGSTSKVRGNLQNSEKKIRLAGTSGGCLLQTPPGSRQRLMGVSSCLHLAYPRDAGLRWTLWDASTRHLQQTPHHLSQLPLLYSQPVERNGLDKGFVPLWRS